MIYKWFAQTEKRERNPGSVTMQSNLFYKNKRKQTKQKTNKPTKNKNTTQNPKTTEKTNIFY